MNKYNFVSIDYDEENPESYRAVVVRLDGEESIRFESGEFIQDWSAAMNTIKGQHFMCSSSVDNYMMEAGYEFDEETNE